MNRQRSALVREIGNLDTEVSIQVEITRMVVGGRRISKSDYRQFYAQPLVNPDGTFAGTPVGVVHHHLEACEPQSMDTPHLHVIWCNEAAPRRCRVEMPIFPKTFQGDDVEYWNWLSTILYSASICLLSVPKNPTGTILVRFDEGLVEVEISSEHAYLLWPDHFPGFQESARHDIRANYGAEPESEELWRVNGGSGWIADINHRIRREREMRRQHSDRYSELKALPQIFIGA